MDPTTVISIVMPIVLAIGGGWVRSLQSRMNRAEAKHDALDKEYREHLASLPQNFVAKDDYRADVQDIKETLREMRLDMKTMLGSR